VSATAATLLLDMPSLILVNNMYVTLVAKTLKGKNKLQEVSKHFGWDKNTPVIWKELESKEVVIFSDEKGPWLRLIPAADEDVFKFTRWVHLTNDKDFVVTEIVQ
jgi:hypothetical protein